MTKRRLLEDFYCMICDLDPDRVWFSSFVDEWINKLSKDTCKTLYDLADSGIYNFRILKNVIYWLDSDYNRHVVWSRH